MKFTNLCQKSFCRLFFGMFIFSKVVLRNESSQPGLTRLVSEHYLREYKHSKKQSAETLLAQIGKFHLQAIPYKLSYDSQVNTPLSWWRMCKPTPPYIQLGKR